jgi:hypothetical protein
MGWPDAIRDSWLLAAAGHGDDHPMPAATRYRSSPSKAEPLSGRRRARGSVRANLLAQVPARHQRGAELERTGDHEEAGGAAVVAEAGDEWDRNERDAQRDVHHEVPLAVAGWVRYLESRGERPAHGYLGELASDVGFVASLQDALTAIDRQGARGAIDASLRADRVAA